jgi:hypothetical protein
LGRPGGEGVARPAVQDGSGRSPGLLSQVSSFSGKWVVVAPVVGRFRAERVQINTA